VIHLIVGNTGAGKSTYAMRLKEESGGVIFTIDQWNSILFLPDKKEEDGFEWFMERIHRSESLMMELIIQLESNQTDSILDLGFSTFDHREKFRSFARDHGFECTLHFLDIFSAIRKQRVKQRNLEKGDTFEFEVSEKDFAFMESHFEAPTMEELELTMHVLHY
jgi:predicted kinase